MIAGQTGGQFRPCELRFFLEHAEQIGFGRSASIPSSKSRGEMEKAQSVDHDLSEFEDAPEFVGGRRNPAPR
jgi:hypothetical protein